MLDGGTYRLYFTNLETLHNDEKFRFKKFTEGVNDYSCKYRGLNLKLIYSSKCCVIHGSIHKFKNYGKTNKDLFTVTELIKTIQELYQELYMDKCTKIEFSSIEFGVNIKIPYNSQKFIDSILKIKGWKQIMGGIEHESRGNYSFKVYSTTINKTISVKSDSVKYKIEDVLRFEIKIHKTKKLNQIMSSNNFPNIKKFSDLIDIDVFRILGNYILNEYDKLMIYDKNSIDESLPLLKSKDHLLLKKGWDIEYWDSYECLPKNKGKSEDTIRKQKNREMGRLPHYLKLIPQ